ncbi:histidine kinase, partial [Massilia pinisoli]
LAKEINALEIVETAYDSMAVAAAKAGDYKNAYKYQQQFAEHKDKFINLESTKQLSELSVKYETEKKQKLIQQQQFELQRRNMTIMVIAIVFVAMLAIGFQFYTRNKLKQRAALQQAEIEHQARATKGIIEAEEKERKRIASELHDGVGQLFSAVKLNLSGLLDRAQLTDEGM